MEWFQVLVLAVLQGFTEFLPISSSGHLVLPKELLGWPDQGLAFDVAVHVGSLLAVLIYYRRDVTQLLIAWLESIFQRKSSDNSRLAWCIILATIPAGAIGFLANDWIEQSLRGMGVIAATTIVFGILLGVADKMGTRTLAIVDIGWRFALIIGLAQALALIPGTSRSGITITAALFLGLNRDSAAQFSFLLSIPLILAAGGLKSLELIELGTAVPWEQIIVGTLLSGITAYLCIHGFVSLVNKIGMMPFVVYRILLGGVLIVMML